MSTDSPSEPKPPTASRSPQAGPHGGPSAPLPDPSTIPVQGWHCTHTMYRFRRELMSAPLSRGCQDQFRAALGGNSGASAERLAAYWTSGHRADFAVMVMDPDPAKVDAVHQSIISPALGQFVEATWSFVSMSEISEYVPTLEQYRERLISGGAVADSPALAAKINAYERRLPMMQQQRMQPDFPDWPSVCFYPMNKSRVVDANWFTQPFSRRNAMMAEHAQSGIAFAGKVSQLITVGLGLDDWEWMVTLWGRNPQYLKDIVYKMRFDEASAKYGEFGPFYVGYKATADEILAHCKVR